MQGSKHARDRVEKGRSPKNRRHRGVPEEQGTSVERIKSSVERRINSIARSHPMAYHCCNAVLLLVALLPLLLIFAFLFLLFSFLSFFHLGLVDGSI